MSYHCHAKEAAEPILDLALALNYRKRLPAIYTAIGCYYLWVEEDANKGLIYIDQAVEIAEEVADYSSLWIALYLSGLFLISTAEFQDAQRRLKQCLDFSLLANNQMGIAFSKGSISLCDQVEGKMNAAHEFSQDTLTLAKDTGDTFIKGMAYTIYGVSCYHKGLINDAKSHLIEWASLYEKSAPIGWTMWAYAYLGFTHTDLREYDEAVNCYKKIISLMESVNYLPSIIIFFQTCLVRAKMLRHDQDIEVRELFANYQKNKLAYCKGFMSRNIGDILSNMDNLHHADGEVWFQKAIEADTRNGLRWQLANDHAFYADWFRKKGDIQETKEQLTKAIDIFRECSADGWVERMEKVLADTSQIMDAPS
jgi:tetratricopeptide (TPR) repeat protein